METAPAPAVPNQFISQVQTELQRAERYSIFVSLTVFDISVSDETESSRFRKESERLCELIRKNIRSVDFVGELPDSLIGLLLPETSRQGAEMVVKRIGNIVKEELAQSVGSVISSLIPLEIASFPDAGGSRSIRQFLQDWSDKNKN